MIVLLAAEIPVDLSDGPALETCKVSAVTVPNVWSFLSVTV